MLGKRLGNRAMAWGAAFGTLPDLDILFSPLFGPSRLALVAPWDPAIPS